MSFQDKIAQLQQQYYQNHNKCAFFKSKQKTDCATVISSSFNNEHLFANTLYILPNTNNIYFDYIFFKSYANPDIFVEFIDYTYKLILICIQQFKSYALHINWNTYSISAHERYKELYNLFLDKYQQGDLNLHEHLTELCVYYTPNVIHAISGLMRPLMHPDILNKIILFSKSDSKQMLNKLIKQK
jgi:hypothetical protein